jgi:hypothetical protein
MKDLKIESLPRPGSERIITADKMLVPIADGIDEIEAVFIIDVLRRKIDDYFCSL